MGQSFYNANSSKTGCGCGFSFNSKDQSVYISFVQQSDWNSSTKTGSFGGEKVNIKLSKSEAGGIINAIEKQEEFSGFHDSGKGDYDSQQKTQIKFMPFGEAPNIKFGLSVTKTVGTEKTPFKISFTKGDAVVIREYLLFALDHFNSANYSEEKKRRIDAEKNKKTSGNSTNEEDAAF